MALVLCKECSKQISNQAKNCPNCGGPVPKSVGPFGYLMVLFVGLLFYKGCGSARESATDREAVSKNTQASPELTMEEKLRIGQTILVMTSIKQSMRDPTSITWVSVLTSDDASVVCATYRARNGFGGMNIEHSTGTANGISNSTSMWNKRCAANLTLNDMTHVQRTVP